MANSIQNPVSAFKNENENNVILSTIADYQAQLNDIISRGGNIMTDGIAVLYKFMNLFGDLAQVQYDQMSAKADRARNSQDMANRLDVVINGLTDPKSTAVIPDDVLQYLRDNKILVNGKSIDDYLSSLGTYDPKKPTLVDKGVMDLVKASLETDSSRCSDFVTQAQLKIQKLMQSYNVATSTINSMQTLLAEMLKGISSNIR